MRPDDARAIALRLPEAVERSHMGHPDFRVGEKIFATISPDGRAVNLKATAEQLDALVAAEPATYKRIWGGRYLGVELARVSREALRALIRDSWALVAPKRLVAALRRTR